MATSNDIKNGTVIKEGGQLWSVVEFQHVKPGKGGAFVRTKQKNVVSGKIIDKTYNAGAKIETATVDRRDYQYLYPDGADFVFMDKSDYDQLTVSGTVVGDAASFMLENQDVQIALQARLGVGDLEHDARGQLEVERLALVQGDLHVLVLEHEAGGVADHGARDGELVLSLIHISEPTRH